MTYIIDIHIKDKKRSYRIEARNEAEAKDRLKLRLPLTERDTFTIDTLKIDMTTVGNEDPFGTFGGE